MAWPGRGAAAVDPARAFSERPESESGCLKRARCQECGSMPIPDAPKLYRIVHIDRLRSIVADGRLLCDATMATRSGAGTMIGISGIKARRRENLLSSHAELRVGDCIPFYFCPRSIMLYMIYRQNDPSLAYKGGQCPIVHLEADMHDVVEWADKKHRRWAFTSSNAGSSYFEDWCDMDRLDEIDREAVQSWSWQNCKDEKQAEFLIEQSCPWELVERIGVRSGKIRDEVNDISSETSHRPAVEIERRWYY